MWILLIGPSDWTKEYTQNVIDIHNKYKLPLIRTAFRMLGNWDDAEDAAMEGMQNFIAHVDEIYAEPESKDEDYIRHKLYDYVLTAAKRIKRRKQTRAKHRINIEDLDDIPDIRPEGPSEWFLDMRALFKSLPDNQRQVFELVYFNGWSYDEIANLMDTTADNVRHIHKRGIDNLKKYVDSKHITKEDIAMEVQNGIYR